MMARNRCCRCGHEWQDRPSGYAVHQACPACDSEYWEWTNFDETAEAGPGPTSVSLLRERMD